MLQKEQKVTESEIKACFTLGSEQLFRHFCSFCQELTVISIPNSAEPPVKPVGNGIFRSKLLIPAPATNISGNITSLGEWAGEAHKQGRISPF